MSAGPLVKVNYLVEYTFSQLSPRGTMTFEFPVGTPEETVLAAARDAGCKDPAIVKMYWESWAWPGGYPLFYVCADGGVLCPNCANQEIDQTADPEAEPCWRIDAVDINYEDPSLYCDHCDKQIKSAYAGAETDEGPEPSDGDALASAGHGTDEDYEHNT